MVELSNVKAGSKVICQLHKEGVEMSRLISKIPGLVRQGWNEIPEVILTTCIAYGTAIVSLAITLNKTDDELNNHRYKFSYIVLRPDDPRIANVHKD